MMQQSWNSLWERINLFCCSDTSNISLYYMFLGPKCKTWRSACLGHKSLCQMSHILLGQNIMSRVFGVQGYSLFLNANECCMSRPRSKVRRPMATPDGTFPLLEKEGARKHRQFKHDIYWQGECILNLDWNSVKGQSVWPYMGTWL